MQLFEILLLFVVSSNKKFGITNFTFELLLLLVLHSSCVWYVIVIFLDCRKWWSTVYFRITEKTLRVPCGDNFTVLTLTGGKQFFIFKYADYSSDTLNRATSSSAANESVICMNWKLQILRLLVNEGRKTSETCSKILAATWKYMYNDDLASEICWTLFSPLSEY